MLSLIKKISVGFILLNFLASASFALAKVDLNTATQKELEDLPGIGSATAKKIIEARPLKSIDDLTAIKGIKAKQMDKLKDLVTVSGSTPETAAVPAAVTPSTEQAKSATASVETDVKKAKAKVSALAPGEKININTASLEQIEKLPGIGPKKAQAIIEARPFKSAEDVMKIKGIKQGLFNKIKDHITL